MGLSVYEYRSAKNLFLRSEEEVGKSGNPRKRRAADDSDTDILAEGGKGEAAKKKAKGGG